MLGKEMNIFQNANTSQSPPTDLRAGILAIDNWDLRFTSMSSNRKEVLDNKNVLFIALMKDDNFLAYYFVPS